MTTVYTTAEFDKWMFFDFNQNLSFRQCERKAEALQQFKNGNFPDKVKLIIAQIGQHHISECTSFKVVDDKIQYYVREHQTKWGGSLKGHRKLDLNNFCKYLAVTRRIKF